jgi:hypothetical protein
MLQLPHPGNACVLVWAFAAVMISGGCSGSSERAANTATGVVERLPPQPADPAPAPVGGGNTSPKPTVTLAADQQAVRAGSSVLLRWTSASATECLASGGWSGARSTKGSVVVGPLTQRTTFSLSCTGAGGSAVAMLSVGVAGVVTLTWQPPRENVDGSPLTNLAGYRIYYGERSRSYQHHQTVSNPAAVRHDLTLTSGSYYVAMTALDREGNESAYSNEVVRTLP